MSDFKPGLEGVIAFETEIAEPDKEGGALRYRGVDIEDLVGQVSFGNVWGLLVDNEFNPGLPPAEPFPLPVHSGDVRVDVQSALAMLAPAWGFRQLLDIDEQQARDNLARASVMALSFVAQSARGIGLPMVPQSEIDKASTIVERFMIRWRGEPDPRARPGRRRLLDLRRRARHERVDVHRARHRLDRRRRRGLPVRRGRARCPVRCTAAPRRGCCTCSTASRTTGDATAYVKGVLDRGERLMGFGHRVYRAEDPRARVLRRTAARARRSPRYEVAAAAGEGRSRGAARPPAGPGAGDQRGVLGGRGARLRRGPGAHVHADVHLRAHGRLVARTSSSRSAPAG